MKLMVSFLLAVLFGQPAARLEDCLRGDVASLRRFVQHFTPIFRRRIRATLYVAQGWAVSAELIDDLVQATFEAVFGRQALVLTAYDPARGLSLENYLGQLASREAGNYLQKQRAACRGRGQTEVVADPMEASLLQVPESAPTPEARVLANAQRRQLEAALLERLTPLGQIYFRLLYVEELEMPEIMAAMGVGEDVVYSWRKRIKAALRDVLEEQKGDLG